jgi:hypothetical protein
MTRFWSSKVKDYPIPLEVEDNQFLKKRRIALSIELFGMAMCQEMSALLMGKKKRLLLNGGSL